MEEIDQIQLLTLRRVGCSFEEESYDAFRAESLLPVVAHLLSLIQNRSDFPRSLPREMSGKFRVATIIAQAIDETGYPNDVQFNQLLYPNEKDTRKIISWLIGCLPKVEESDDRSELSFVESQYESLRQHLQTPSFLLGCMQLPSRPCELRSIKSLSSPAEYDLNFLPELTQQVRARTDLRSSVISLLTRVNDTETVGSVSDPSKTELDRTSAAAFARYAGKLSQGIKRQREIRSRTQRTKPNSGLSHLFGDTNARSSKFSREKAFTQEVATPTVVAPVDVNPSVEETVEVEDEETRRLREIQELEDEYETMSKKQAELEKRMEALLSSLKKKTDDLSTTEKEYAKVEEKYKAEREIHDLLDDFDESSARLRESASSSADRLREMAEEWESVRVPLVQKYRELQNRIVNASSILDERIEDAKSRRQKMQNMIMQLREKEELSTRLTEEYDRLPKDVDRTWYTRRIMDIVKNVKNQQHEIDKVLVDTRAIQREIRNLSDALNRCFTTCEEFTFKEARSNEAFRQAYRDIVALREAFDSLVEHVENRGQVSNQVRVLDNSIRQTRERNEEFDMQQVLSDLEELRREMTSFSQ